MATMASCNSSLLAILLFNLLFQGFCQCELKDITIGTERTPAQIEGKQEWNVSFINTCKCPQQALTVSCDGFQSVEKVNPDIFARVGNNCTVNGGRPIAPFATVQFLYAWDPPFIFVPISSHVDCGGAFK
ncbi:uncharacterized protein At1g05835-like [Cynara cardunculus var. scolymus]|uniref:Beta-1,3-N-Acetylglucosaminyltransferase family protein n=1 Tax=Cynara cardunculus var. scolymus TaxID=59895 RepID=A0A103XTE1_CYNCS|nr:uncharacterized protein At1g05835-like [Cynara cardunculus var. scolymus]KVH96508.1 hypothetical protein Ccrd_001409 [Cynara cardunculus var. scolymus]